MLFKSPLNPKPLCLLSISLSNSFLHFLQRPVHKRPQRLPFPPGLNTDVTGQNLGNFHLCEKLLKSTLQIIPHHAPTFSLQSTNENRVDQSSSKTHIPLGSFLVKSWREMGHL